MFAEIIAGVAGAVSNVIDDFVYTDEERAGLEAQMEAARAQAQLAKATREAAMFQAQAAQYQAAGASTTVKGNILTAVVVGGALVAAALIWKGKAA